MRHFASSSARLWHLPREAKIIYSFFCALSLLALLSSLLLYGEITGGGRSGTLRRVRAYYGAPQGDNALAPPPQAPAGDGPHIELPDEAEPAPSAPAGELLVAMPYRKLLEVSHFHLFTMPLFLLVVTHLFVMTGLSRRSKTAWVVLGWCAATLHILTPWLVRYAHAAAAVLYPVSGVGLLGSALVLTGLPLWAMWRPPRRHAERRGKLSNPAAASHNEAHGQADPR